MDGSLGFVLGFVLGAIVAAFFAVVVSGHEWDKSVERGFFTHKQRLYQVIPAKAVSP